MSCLTLLRLCIATGFCTLARPFDKCASIAQATVVPRLLQGNGSGLGEAGIPAVYPGDRRPPGGLGLDPAYLGLQLRKLQKKQKGLVKEVQAAAAREAFWRSSAHTAEQAVDEVASMHHHYTNDRDNAIALWMW